MSFKTVQGKLQKKGFSAETSGKILGAAAQKAKHPSANQKKVLKAQGSKRPKKRRTPRGFGNPTRKPHGIGDKTSKSGSKSASGFEKFRAKAG
jgi:hypothetical protein